VGGSPQMPGYGPAAFPKEIVRPLFRRARPYGRDLFRTSYFCAGGRRGPPPDDAAARCPPGQRRSCPTAPGLVADGGRRGSVHTGRAANPHGPRKIIGGDRYCSGAGADGAGRLQPRRPMAVAANGRFSSPAHPARGRPRFPPLETLSTSFPPLRAPRCSSFSASDELLTPAPSRWPSRHEISSRPRQGRTSFHSRTTDAVQRVFRRRPPFLPRPAAPTTAGRRSPPSTAGLLGGGGSLIVHATRPVKERRGRPQLPKPGTAQWFPRPTDATVSYFDHPVPRDGLVHHLNIDMSEPVPRGRPAPRGGGRR